MRKLKKACLTSLMSLAVLASIPAFSADYINAEGFADANGISHQWFPIQKMLIMRKGINSIKFRIGDPTATANNKVIQLSGAPKIQNNMIYVPADALQGIFSGATTNIKNSQSNLVKPPTALPTAPKATPQPVQQPAQQPVAVPVKAPVAQVQPAEAPVQQTAPVQPPSADSSAILIALRHSLREDHTRVVLEFNNPVTYKSDFKNGVYRLTLSGCKNLIPTKRTDPKGRDIEKFDLNSGPNREGLILTCVLTQTDKAPYIETVADPFRMIICFPIGAPKPPEVATATTPIAPPQISLSNDSAPVAAKPVEQEKAPEINIEVPLEPLTNKNFLGRTIIIDAGHGGIDTGFEFEGRPSEKVINLETAKFLKAELEKAGFKAVLIRSTDVNMSYSQRLSLANKNGGDLFISIHTGGSKDITKNGVACYTFTNEGIYHDSNAQGAVYDAVFQEWLKNTRFDLAEFLAKKINTRLVKHLLTESRGVKKSPLLPLKFIMNPAVLVEIGMLSDKVEGKNLISDKYRQAIAKSITNSVIDFFNGIEMK